MKRICYRHLISAMLYFILICFIIFMCEFVSNHLPILFRVTALSLEQSYDYPDVSEVTQRGMGESASNWTQRSTARLKPGIFVHVFFPKMYCKYIYMLIQSCLVSLTLRYHTGNTMMFKKSNTLPNVCARFMLGCGRLWLGTDRFCPYPLSILHCR